MSHESCTLVEMIDKLFKSINWDCLLYMRVYIRYWWIFQSYIIQMCVCLYIHKKKKNTKSRTRVDNYVHNLSHFESELCLSHPFAWRWYSNTKWCEYQYNSKTWMVIYWKMKTNRNVSTKHVIKKHVQGETIPS